MVIDDFVSLNNKNLTIVNVRDMRSLHMEEIMCSDTIDLTMSNEDRVLEAKTKGKTNTCFYIRDFYESLDISKLRLENLVSMDNSLFVI